MPGRVTFLESQKKKTLSEPAQHIQVFNWHPQILSAGYGLYLGYITNTPMTSQLWIVPGRHFGCVYTNVL